MSQSTPLRRPGLMVFLCGIGTSIATLFLLNLLQHADINVMGWYLNGVFPAGALIAGIASGAGYAIGSRVLNAKLTKLYVLGMLVTGVLDWLGARWVDYEHVLDANHLSSAQLTFSNYLRVITESMAFTRSGSNAPGEALGAWGYAYRVLEIGGYAAGVMFPSAFLLNQPYCKSCQLYLRKQFSRYVTSPTTAKQVHAASRGERAAKLEEAIGSVMAPTQPLLEKLPALSYEETVVALEPLEKKASGAAASVEIVLKKCPGCDCHYVNAVLGHTTVGKKPAFQRLAVIEKPPLAPGKPAVTPAVA